MSPYIFPGLPKVLQQDIICSDLMNVLYKDMQSMGGYDRWRDAIIMENTKSYSSDWILAHNRDRQKELPTDKWMPSEDLQILKFKYPMATNNRSLKGVTNRLYYLKGKYLRSTNHIYA